MAKTLKTSGDYTVKAGGGNSGSNTIKLDSRDVRVTGNLTVDGDQVVQNVTNTTIEDQFLEINRNYSGAGAEDAGIVINQGTEDNAIFYFDGSDNEFRIGTSPRFIQDGSSVKWEIDGGAFTLTNLKVATTPSHANHAASKNYVDTQVGGGFSLKVAGDDSTQITVATGNTLQFTGGSNINTASAEPDTITLNLDNDLTNITSITSDASNGNLELVANGTGDVVINNVLTFSGTETTPAIDSSIPKLYHKTAAGGGTGVFFVNSDVSATDEGELISKKKATALAIALG
jgi:hypothetical protein